MKRSIAVLWCVVAGVVGLAGGYAIRVTTHESGGTSDELARGSWDGSEDSSKSEIRQVSHAAEVKSKVRRSKGSHRWLHWMSGVADASLEQLPGLARLAKDNPGALRMIAYRWIELDPQHFFETLQAESKKLDSRGQGTGFPISGMARYLFEEWPRLDEEAAIAALGDAEAMVGMSGLRHSVLNTIFKENPKRGFALLSEWSILHFGPNTDGLKKWARRDPRAAAQAALDNPVGYGAEYSMKAIAKVWAEDDPAAAIEFALESSGRLGRTLRDTVLATWAGKDRAAAAEWLARQEDEMVRSQLSPFIVEAWAKEDPGAALSWCQENLEGHRLISAVTKLAEGAAAHDAQAAAALVGGMEDSPARTQAAIALSKKWFPQSWPSDQSVEPERSRLVA